VLIASDLFCSLGRIFWLTYVLLRCALQLCKTLDGETKLNSSNNKFLNSDGKTNHMVDAYVKLLQDGEAEVRTAAAFKVSGNYNL